MMLKMKEISVKIDWQKVIILISFHIFLFSCFTYINWLNVFLLIFLIKMYAHNKNICLKLRNICFTKSIDSLKTT